MNTSTLRNHPLHALPAASPRRGSAATAVAPRLRTLLRRWLSRWRSRREIYVALRLYAQTGGGPWNDLLVSRDTLLCEARKPFWRT